MDAQAPSVETANAACASAPAGDARLQALAAAGAPSRAPLDWHFVTVLAQRAQTETGAVQARLTDRLALAIAALQAKLSTDACDTPAAQPAASPLAQLLQAMGAAPQAGEALAPQAHERASGAPARARPSPRPELKSVGRMRKTLSRLKVRQQVNQALAQPPQHAGPINSQMLVLRSLALMQEISPEYLHRFMAHVDALMTLEDAQRLPVAAKASPKNSKPPGPSGQARG